MIKAGKILKFPDPPPPKDRNLRRFVAEAHIKHGLRALRFAALHVYLGLRNLLSGLWHWPVSFFRKG